MNYTKFIIGAVVVVFIGILFYSFSGEKEEPQTQVQGNHNVIEDQEPTVGDNVVNDDVMIPEDSAESKDNEVVAKAGFYGEYSEEKLRETGDDGAVLFFSAVWCPTCRTLDRDIKANIGNIPDGLSILTLDYDSETELKKKYGVTFQHTLVQVDKDGNFIKKWSGSPTLKTLVSQIQK